MRIARSFGEDAEKPMFFSFFPASFFTNRSFNCSQYVEIHSEENRVEESNGIFEETKN